MISHRKHVFAYLHVPERGINTRSPRMCIYTAIPIVPTPETIRLILRKGCLQTLINCIQGTKDTNIHSGKDKYAKLYVNILTAKHLLKHSLFQGFMMILQPIASRIVIKDVQPLSQILVMSSYLR